MDAERRDAGAAVERRANTELPRDCTSAEDCTVTLNGCCDCANGGEDIAVNKARVAEFRKQFDCSRDHCNNDGAMAPCGSGAVSCVAGLCRYAKPVWRR